MLTRSLILLACGGLFLLCGVALLSIPVALITTGLLLGSYALLRDNRPVQP